MRPRLLAHIAVLAANIFFAANFSFVKMITPRLVAPFGLNVYRVGCSLVLFWLLWLLAPDKRAPRRSDIGRIIACGLTGVAVNQMLFIRGLTLTTSIHAALLMLTTPLLITLFALLVLREKLTRTQVPGLLLGVAGAAWLIAGGAQSRLAPNPLLGDALILVNAISYSMYFILVKPLMTRYTPLEVVRWVFTAGFVFMLPFGWKQAAGVPFTIFTATDWAALAAVVFTGTFLAYCFNAYGIRHLGAGTAGAYIYTQPVFAVFIATLVLNEQLSLEKGLAAALIFAGVFLATRKPRKNEA
ncbi:DMT family transporter [Flaviaesturariibacter flavus]|uniref:DMT family transporter n=1 Tax=Flaviaesturariibacter flavus TaxID=2502780 RepID=A0A4R1BIG3_9BACT|nr:DMT family transporter [Flaviaesturariibacter flavus]TCJ17034.1 DMT family transporter [Flaviaesturariibacter flavus]